MENKKYIAVAISIEDRNRIKLFIEKFKEKTSFKISLTEFVRQAINEKLEGKEL